MGNDIYFIFVTNSQLTKSKKQTFIAHIIHKNSYLFFYSFVQHVYHKS